MNERLRVWYIGKVPAKAEDFVYIEVEDVKQAKLVLHTLTERDLKDDRVTDNAMGLEEYDPCGDEWCEWYDDEGRDIKEVM